MIPDYLGLGFSRDHALRLVAILEELAPFCEECATMLADVKRQLAILAGEPVHVEPGRCGNCAPTG